LQPCTHLRNFRFLIGDDFSSQYANFFAFAHLQGHFRHVNRADMVGDHGFEKALLERDVFAGIDFHRTHVHIHALCRFQIGIPCRAPCFHLLDFVRLGGNDFFRERAQFGAVALFQHLFRHLYRAHMVFNHAVDELSIKQCRIIHLHHIAMTMGQEDERKQLARELHDQTVQSLIALKQQIELVEKSLEQEPTQRVESAEQIRTRVADRLRRLHPLVVEIIDDLRRHIHGLRPLYLEDLGLVTALEMLVKQMGEEHNLIGDFQVLGEVVAPMDPTIELSAFRIVQEAMRNVAIHAQAEWVHIELIFDAQGMTLRIEDNGIGFDAPKHPHQLAQYGHYGLVGIQERVQLHGGRLEIESEPEKGTMLTAWLPT
jgi:signal transduction histidine kinase